MLLRAIWLLFVVIVLVNVIFDVAAKVRADVVIADFTVVVAGVTIIIQLFLLMSL